MLRNVAINYVGLILPTFISLVTVPAYIKLLGVERYGVVSVVWVLIGYFSVLDLGMSMAAQNHISKTRSLNDKTQCENVFWSALWLNLATGLVGGLFIYCGALAYTKYFTAISVEFREEIHDALPWLALAIPVANVSWVFAGAINGAERFGIYNANQTFGTFLFQLLPLAAAWFIAPSLSNVLAAAVLARVLAAFLLARASFKVLDIQRIRTPQLNVVKALFRFGGWMLVSGIVGTITDTLDRVFIGNALGARFVTYYTVPQNLVMRLGMLPNALIRTLFPRLSTLGRDHADTLIRRALEFLNGAFTPIVIVAMFALNPFLKLWVGETLASASSGVGRILIVSVWLMGQAGVTRVLIQSQIAPSRAACAGLLELPIFITALILSISYFGLIGAAVSVVVRAFADYCVLLYLSAIRARSIVLDMLAHLTLLLGALYLASAVTHPAALIICMVMLVSLDIGWSLLISSALREFAHTLLQRALRTIARRWA